MKSKWFYSFILIACIAITTYVGKQQTGMPNQAIVLVLNDEGANVNFAHQTLTVVENELFKLGAENVEVSLLQDGQFKITYFSDLKVSSIKNVLSKTDGLGLNFAINSADDNKPPLEEGHDDFQLNIFEITSHTDYDSGLGGKSAIEVKTDFNRISNVEKTNLTFASQCFDSNFEIRSSSNFFDANKFLSSFISVQIPESRAGPIKTRDIQLC